VWQKKVIEPALHPEKKTVIAVAGKYIELQDAYKSIYEALRHGGFSNNARIVIKRVDSEDIEKKGAAELLSDVGGVLVPGGFGTRGIEGKISAIRFARVHEIPFLGICLGMQLAAIEFSRNVLGIRDAHSTEFNRKTKNPVIFLLPSQRAKKNLGGTMRLGLYPCRIKKETKAYAAYGKELIQERHRHRYEFNNKYKKLFEGSGVVFSGIYQKKNLVEIMELKNHPWFLASQFHPEFKSRPDRAHPLFREFIKYSIVKYESKTT